MIIESLALLLIAGGLFEMYRRNGSRNKTVEKIRHAVNYQVSNALGIASDVIYRSKNRLGLVKPMYGKVAIVTGGSRGLGAEVSKCLFMAGVHVIVAVRNVEAGEKFVEKVKRESVKVHDRSMAVMELDVSSMKSVKKFVQDVKKLYPQIHMLVNNAGVLFSDFKLTEDGFESQLATNYLGHFYLTHLLLDNLKRAGENSQECARIVNVSSCIHYCTEIWFDDINMEKCHDPVGGYARSKLAQLMSTRHLTRILEAEKAPVKCYAAHPGLVATDMFYKTPMFKNLSWMGKILKSPEEGSVSILYCCLAEELENRGGAYISNCQEGWSTSFSKNEEHQKRLHDLTCQMLDIKSFGALDQ